jgi:hypothetical protein
VVLRPYDMGDTSRTSTCPHNVPSLRLGAPVLFELDEYVAWSRGASTHQRQGCAPPRPRVSNRVSLGRATSAESTWCEVGAAIHNGVSHGVSPKRVQTSVSYGDKIGLSCAASQMCLSFDIASRQWLLDSESVAFECPDLCHPGPDLAAGSWCARTMALLRPTAWVQMHLAPDAASRRRLSAQEPTLVGGCSTPRHDTWSDGLYIPHAAITWYPLDTTFWNEQAPCGRGDRPIGSASPTCVTNDQMDSCVGYHDYCRTAQGHVYPMANSDHDDGIDDERGGVADLLVVPAGWILIVLVAELMRAGGQENRSHATQPGDCRCRVTRKQRHDDCLPSAIGCAEPTRCRKRRVGRRARRRGRAIAATRRRALWLVTSLLLHEALTLTSHPPGQPLFREAGFPAAKQRGSGPPLLSALFGHERPSR